MKKTDLLLVAGALIIAGGIWFFYSAGAEKGKGVEITVDGESKAFLPLGEDDSIRIDTDGGYNAAARTASSTRPRPSPARKWRSCCTVRSI